MNNGNDTVPYFSDENLNRSAEVTVMGNKVQHGRVVDSLRDHQLDTTVSPYVRDGSIYYLCTCGEWSEDHAAHQARQLGDT